MELLQRNNYGLLTPAFANSMDYQNLTQELSAVKLTATQDLVQWKWLSAKNFSTKQRYRLLLDGGIKPHFSQIIWKTRIPEKIKYFAYLSYHGKILTKANLNKRGWKGKLDSCTLCDQSFEMVDHLFLQCSFTRKVWSSLLLRLGLKPLPQNQTELWNTRRVEEPMLTFQNAVDTLLITGQWTLWKEQNKRCFEFHAFLPNQVRMQIMKLFILWTYQVPKSGSQANILEPGPEIENQHTT